MTLQEATVAQLIEGKKYCLNFIMDANCKISAQGGWIAREANWEQIKICQRELDEINEELAKR